MNVVIWVIIVHLIEVIGIAGYLLIHKNNKLERVIAEQQNYIDTISIIIQDSENTIRELDARGAFESDDGTFVTMLPKSQTTVKIKPLTYGEILEIQKMSESYPQGRTAPKVTWRLNKQIVEEL